MGTDDLLEVKRQLEAARWRRCQHIDIITLCRQYVGMTRTQIQLPDEVYERARKVCQSREISLAELARRGLEYILSVYSSEPGGSGEWNPPQPRRLGWMGLSDVEIKQQAQLTVAEAVFTRRRKK